MEHRREPAAYRALRCSKRDPTTSVAMKTMLLGVAWIVGASWFLLSAVGNPIADLRLTINGTTTTGSVLDTFEDVQDLRGCRRHPQRGAQLAGKPRRRREGRQRPAGRLMPALNGSRLRTLRHFRQRFASEALLDEHGKEFSERPDILADARLFKGRHVGVAL
jgi:hypothetical protein